MAHQLMDSPLAQRAKEALAKHEWRGAFDLLTEADAAGTLSAAELELLAQASWWVGRLPATIEARERAYAAAMQTGDMYTAVVAAIILGRDYVFKNAHSMGAAWLNRAERLLEGVPENPAHGYLAVTRAFEVGQTNRLDEALGHALRARDIASRFDDRDLQALALSCTGLIQVYLGRLEEGLAAMDEATIAASGGELLPLTAGGVYCTTIGACAALGDWLRAAQWTEVQDRWCQREHINGFPGMCRLYRAEIKRLRGAWLEAETEARRASDELQGYIPAAVGLAQYEIGMIRLRRGDLPAAEDALLRAHSFNRDPEPGLSLVRLAQGRIAAAAESIRRALDEPEALPGWGSPPGSEINRLALLPAQAEIALVAGDVATARAASDELASLAERFRSVAVQASATSTLGAVQLAEGDPAAATRSLRHAIQLWTELDAPYEGARARVILAQAYAADGGTDRATLELQNARATFDRLGAIPDLRRTEEAIAAIEGPSDVRARSVSADAVVRTFVFTDIVDSTRLAELVGDEAWTNLIRWHDQTLRSLVAEHKGEEIKATGDGLFLAFDDPDRAIECAIAIQRRLAEHRQAQGFAPAVRIGAHRAEANRAGLDYIGTGVNTAARVGGQAGGGEILVSAATLASARRSYTEVARRTVELKGIAEPVEVVSIDWR